MGTNGEGSGAGRNGEQTPRGTSTCRSCGEWRVARRKGKGKTLWDGPSAAGVKAGTKKMPRCCASASAAFFYKSNIIIIIIYLFMKAFFLCPLGWYLVPADQVVAFRSMDEKREPIANGMTTSTGDANNSISVTAVLDASHSHARALRRQKLPWPTPALTPL